MNFSDKHVLIVEDQRPFLVLLRGLLHSMGASNVVTKSSAEKALSVCRKQKFDVIVCDLHLGSNKKNGFEFVEELRVRRLAKPTSVFIIISADSARPVVLGSIERRPDDFLIKPFSQAQLKTRITRAWQKRQFLAPVYFQMAQQNLDAAIDICETLLANPSPYRGTCEQLLVELYWQSKQPDKALDVLTPYLDGKPIMWAQVALGKTYLQLKDFDKAIEMAELVIKRNRFSPDAHDILAQATDAKNQGELAISAIKEAIKLSPFSLTRHFQACAIARNYNDYFLASASSLAIWDLSKRTAHYDSLHWCGYVRSLLDVAEYTDDKSQRNRYQQEALLAVQRGKFDEYLQRLTDEFDVGIFTTIINARVNVLDGKMLDAKRQLSHSQIAIEEKYESPPTAFIPDSVKVMYDLGEYEDAIQLKDLLKRRGLPLDQNSTAMLASEELKARQKLADYQKYNREGIQYYQQGEYKQARASFALAQEIAPVNVGVTLNLLQCISQIFNQTGTTTPGLMQECRRLYKIVDDMPLKKQHEEKYIALKKDIDSLIS